MNEWALPKNVETQSIERVGGGGFAWESGVYDATVKMVYLNQAVSEARSFNIILENSEGKELRETFWVRSGKAKGNKVYYEKNGKQFPLPGYSLANSLCVAAVGESLAKCIESAEKKTINIWNSEIKKEAPTERPVVMKLVNKPIKVAVHQVIEDRMSKDSNGLYVSTGESRTVNNCKFFGNGAGKTAEEITKGAESTMFDKWAARNTGTIVDKSSKTKTTSAANIMGTSANTNTNDKQGSLFS